MINGAIWVWLEPRVPPIIHTYTSDAANMPTVRIPPARCEHCYCQFAGVVGNVPHRSCCKCKDVHAR